MFHHHVFLSIVYACVIVVLYKVDIEVMSGAGFKCRAAFVAQGGNPVHFFHKFISECV